MAHQKLTLVSFDHAWVVKAFCYLNNSKLLNKYRGERLIFLLFDVLWIWVRLWPEAGVAVVTPPAREFAALAAR